MHHHAAHAPAACKQDRGPARGCNRELRARVPCVQVPHAPNSFYHPAQGWEAVGRLRVSAGLEVERLAGAFRRRTPTDLDFPAISCDTLLSEGFVTLHRAGRRWAGCA